ncbi:hypothetical protein KKA47_05150, partial [bacterium]|nr:hypothetical protein [bacterium]
MLFEQIFRKFSKRKVRYLVVGGIAVNLHGFGRATGDLDIMLALDDSNIKKFVDVVNDLQFIPRLPVKVEEFADSAKRDLWINEKNMKVFSVYNPKNPIEHIDIMVENYIDFKKAYSNRENMHAGDITIP